MEDAHRNPVLQGLHLYETQLLAILKTLKGKEFLMTRKIIHAELVLTCAMRDDLAKQKNTT